MFKLVAVGGKLRGQSFELENGDNIVGRSSSSEIAISVEGVSKKHFKITVNGENCYVQDLGSSNGTFVNGKLVKNATVNNKDQIAIPNVIFQVVYVKEKLIRKEGSFKDTEMDYSLEAKEEMPPDLGGKIKFIFKNKVMSVLYSFNEQYEWSVLVGILMFLFICLNISVSISPVLIRNRVLLLSEVKKRAGQYVDEVVRNSAIHMMRGDFQKIDTKYLDNYGSGDGLKSYELIDMERRIVRPAAKIDTYSNDPVSINAIEDFKKTKKYGDLYFDRDLGNGEIGVARALQVSDPRTGALRPVGIISMRFVPQGLKDAKVASFTAYLEALVYSSMFGVVFFAIFYYLTMKPLNEMKLQTINARAKRIKELSSKSLFTELIPIREEINGLLQSISELDGDEDSEVMIDEDDEPYIDMLFEITKGTNCATIIINSDKIIQHSNEKAYDVIGIREEFAKDKELIETIEKDGLADELVRLCDESSDRDGESATDEYELGGVNYNLFVKAAMGKAKTARAYLITFVKEV